MPHQETSGTKYSQVNSIFCKAADVGVPISRKTNIKRFALVQTANGTWHHIRQRYWKMPFPSSSPNGHDSHVLETRLAIASDTLMKNHSITSAVDVLTTKEWSSFDRVSFSKKINWYKNRKRLTDKIATDSNNMLIMGCY